MLDIKNLNQSFGQKSVLRDISLTVKEGEFVSLLGPSGCGKTSLLRIIAGHDKPQSGEVHLKSRNITLDPPNKRPIHTVFQRYALFPHMTVFDNVAFGLRCQKKAEPEIKSRVEEVLALVGLKGQGHRGVTSLSGGEQQRVALVRALVTRPLLLLLDEPLGALDAKLRLQLQQELVSIQKKFGITFVFVTHDQQEALNMSDRIALLNNGVIEQLGTPHEIYESPKTFFAAGFVGSLNVLQATVQGQKERDVSVEVSGLGTFTVENSATQHQIGRSGQLCIRPEKLMLYSKRPSTAQNVCEGKIKNQIYLGTYTQFEVVTKTGQVLLVFQQNSLKLAKKVFKNDDNVFLGWPANASHFFEN